MGLDSRFNLFGTGYLPPGFEALLKSDDACLRRGDLYSFEDFLPGDAQVQGNLYWLPI